MKNKVFIAVLAISIILSGFSSALALGSETTVADKKFYSDYRTVTDLSDSTFNASDFKISIDLKHIDWLGINDERSETLKFKSNIGTVNLYDVLPNLRVFALAEEIAQTKLVGYTFACTNIGGTWNTDTGRWEVNYNDPAGRIRTALDEFSSYVTTQYVKPNYNSKVGNWTDSKLTFQKGTRVQFGNSVIEFTGSCTIDDLYDPIKHPGSYASQIAYCASMFKKRVRYENSADKAISLYLPKGSFIQTCETKVLLNRPLTVTIFPGEYSGNDPLKSLYDALQTANGTTQTKFGGSTCDHEALASGIFSSINELIGVLAQPSTRIVVGDGDGALPDSTEDTGSDIAAEIKIISNKDLPCTHSNTKTVDRIEPTVTTVGYSGDVVCADCGLMIREGDILPKLPSSIKVNRTSIKLRKGKSSNVLRVTFVKGDRIRSVRSSDESIVKAVKSGTNSIKLTAGSRTGTATIKIKLASGKSTTVTVKVQNAAVACTALAKMTAKGSEGLVLTWSDVKGADGYDIFFARCGKKSKFKRVKTVKAGKTLKWTKKGLKKETAYKAYVKAYVMKGDEKTYIKRTPLVHAYTSGGNEERTNVKSVSVKKTRVSLKVGKTCMIKAKVNKLKKGRKLMPSSHAPNLRYMSSNKKVATVSSSGKIRAKSAGTCKVYVYAVNGVRKTITVKCSAASKQ